MLNDQDDTQDMLFDENDTESIISINSCSSSESSMSELEEDSSSDESDIDVQPKLKEQSNKTISNPKYNEEDVAYRVIGYDVGFKNFAFAVVAELKNGNYALERMRVYDIAEECGCKAKYKSLSSHRLVNMTIEFMMKHIQTTVATVGKVDKIVIEKQPSLNRRMDFVANTVYTTLKVCCEQLQKPNNVSAVDYQSAKLKLNLDVKSFVSNVTPKEWESIDKRKKKEPKETKAKQVRKKKQQTQQENGNTEENRRKARNTTIEDLIPKKTKKTESTSTETDDTNGKRRRTEKRTTEEDDKKEEPKSKKQKKTKEE